MTEANWLLSTRLEDNLKRLRKEASERKLRLYACACARQLWPHFDHPRCFTAIEVAEQVADGIVDFAKQLAERNSMRSIAQWKAWRNEIEWKEVARSVHLRSISRDVIQPDIRKAVLTTQRSTLSAAAELALYESRRQTVSPENYNAGKKAIVEMEDILRHLLQDIFGNPFRPVALDPASRTSTVLALAQQMYESRDFAPMPMLADALQDAGCEDEAVLGHCRSDGPHVRGCWVIDLILGKE